MKIQILSIDNKKHVETTLPSLINSSVIDKVGIRPSPSIDNAIEREIQYRKNLQNVFLSILLFILTATLLYVIPLYPVPIVFLIAIITSVIGFRSPLIGFSLSIFTFIPAYLYQTSVPFWWLLINLFFVGLFTVRSLTNKNNLLSPIIGLISGALFLTPYYFISIPLMLSIVLIRKDHEFLRNLGMCFMFLMILIPFGALSFAYNANINENLNPQEIFHIMSSESLPLFNQLIFNENPRLSSFDLPVIRELFSGILTVQNDVFHPYLFLLIDRLVILFIPLLLLVTFSVVGIMDRIWPWLKLRGVDLNQIPDFSFIFTIILGCIFFIIPLQTMQIPFDYYTSFNFSNSLKTILSAGGFGVILSVSSISLSKRYISAQLNETIKKVCKDHSLLVDAFFEKIKKIQDACPGIDINFELTAANKFKEELLITLDGVDTLSYKILNSKVKIIYELSAIQSENEINLHKKLIEYHNRQLDKSKTLLNSLNKLGIVNLPDIELTHLDPDAEIAFTIILSHQDDLNNFLLELSQNTINISDKLVKVVQRNFDPTLEATSISISENFIQQGQGEQALDSLLVTINSLNQRYMKIMQKTIVNLKKLIKRSVKMYESNVLPLNESLGKDPKTTETGLITQRISKDFENLETFRGILYLPDVMDSLAFLESGTRTVIEELLQLLHEFEKRNDSKIPADFHWGKDTQLISDIKASLGKLDDQVLNDVSDRLSNIEYGIKIIENETNTLKKYLIMNEFILNYINIEPLISSLIKIDGKVLPTQLPVKSKYAIQYLQLFAIGKKKISFDTKTSILHKILKN
ncbi:MAG: hypothetical protein CMO11_01060 [Thaumarchaeota archaeon]|nr:hypothetical protein [Nitrososphaerota archaeon]